MHRWWKLQMWTSRANTEKQRYIKKQRDPFFNYRKCIHVNQRIPISSLWWNWHYVIETQFIAQIIFIAIYSTDHHRCSWYKTRANIHYCMDCTLHKVTGYYVIIANENNTMKNVLSTRSSERNWWIMNNVLKSLSLHVQKVYTQASR